MSLERGESWRRVVGIRCRGSLASTIPSGSSSRAWRLRDLLLGVVVSLSGIVLEGYNLSLELLVELLQLLLLTEDVLAVECHLLSLTVGILLLFFHLLFYLMEHLKELIFLWLRWLDAGR